MQPSGQKTQQSKQRLHFAGSRMGRKVLQNPVIPVLATVGRDKGVIGMSFRFLGALIIGSLRLGVVSDEKEGKRISLNEPDT